MIELSSGLLRSCDLESVARGPTAPQGSYHSHRPSQAGPGSPFPDTNSPTTTEFDAKASDHGPSVFQPSPKQIYDAFITATYDLLISRLCSKLTVIPLCANLFVYLEAQHYSQDESSTDEAPYFGWPSSFHTDYRVKASSSIGVEWLPNGRIFVAICPARTALQPLSTTLRLYNKVPYAEAYIAPFGIKLPEGAVRRKKPELSLRRFSTSGKQSQRQETISMLERRGIKINNDEEWVICYFQPQSYEISSRSLMWPASLIYIHTSAASLGGICNATRPQDIIDPFDASAPNAKSNTFKNNRTVHIDEDRPKDDKDPYAHILENLHGVGMNAIYPTPPDLLRTHQNFHAHRSSAFSAPTPATVSSVPAAGDGETPSVLQDMIMSPDDGVDIKLGDADDHDDLFGDLAIQMGTDALNEDEFGFFDVQRPPTGTTEDGLGMRSHVVSPTTMASPPAMTSVQTVSKVMAAPATVPQKSTTPVKQEDIVMQDDVTPATKPNSMSSPEAVRDAYRRPMTLDEKYASGGMYNQSIPIGGPLSKNPREAPPTLKSIPIMTKPSLKHDISDSSSDDMSDDSNFIDEDNDYDDDEDEDHEYEDEEDDDMRNGNDDSDTSMEGAAVTPSDASERVSKHKDGPSSFLTIDELAKARVPMLICPTKQGPKTETSKIMARLHLRADQYIELAQIVGDQLCYHKGGPQGIFHATSADQQNVARVVEVALEKPSSLDMQSCAGVARATRQQVDSPFSPSPLSEENSYSIPTSDIVVERDGSRMIMSASALSIWTELGLAPSGGPQDVQCYCITPDLPAWIYGAKGVLDAMNDTFASMRLGRHDVGTIGTSNSLKVDGIIGVAVADGFEEYSTSLANAANTFDKLIRSSEPDEHTEIIVVYIVNPGPLTELGCVPVICSVFQKLQHSLDQHDITLVLKILPGTMVAQDGALSIQSPATLSHLAREMYERISQADGTPAPLTHLAPALPAAVPMRLEANPMRRPLDGDAVLHLAYSWSISSPWLTFALTDALGKTKYSSAYYIPWRSAAPPNTNPSTPNPNPGTPNPNGNPTSQPPTPGAASAVATPATPSARTNPWGKESAMGRFVDVIKHLWSSLDKLFPQPKSGMHKLIIAKDSPPVHASEVHVWKMLGQSRGNMELIFLIIDPECPISLIEPPKAHPTGRGKTTWQDPDRMDTSGGGTSSPAPNTPAPAPMAPTLPGAKDPAAEDPSARITRPSDKAFAIESKSIFFCTMFGKLEIVPGAGGCGYLIMREPGPCGEPQAGCRERDCRGCERSEDGLGTGASVVSIRVQFAKAGPQGVDLGGIMRAYRGLATVSEVVGLETRLPWHVAVARKMRMGLAGCM